MSLNNLSFLLFWGSVLFLLVAIQYFGKIHHKQISAFQRFFLLLASYVYVASASFVFCIILIFITMTVYVIGLVMQNKIGIARRLCLIAGLIFTIGILFAFKYLPTGIWPLGISYYIFSMVTYLVDLYRNKIKAEPSLLDFALFTAFFPKFTAGPIVKAREFLPQLKAYDGIKWSNIEQGMQIFVFGLFKKVVIADHLGLFVDDVFKMPLMYDTPTVILAAISYSLQIYFDFSGYSDMAIGVAKSLGISIAPNFNLPYIATNVSEFWKRWHISLSSWLQEYVYFPLGGNRKGEVRTYINLIIVMLISGLWHGNGINFLIWGGLYGIASCIYRAFKKMYTKRAGLKKKSGNLTHILSMVGNFMVVTLFWVFFRATSMSNAFQIMQRIFVYHSGVCQMYVWSFVAILVLIMGTAMAYRRAHKIGEYEINGYYPIMDLGKVGSLTIFFVFIGITIIFGYFGNTVFIYGGF